MPKENNRLSELLSGLDWAGKKIIRKFKLPNQKYSELPLPLRVEAS